MPSPQPAPHGKLPEASGGQLPCARSRPSPTYTTVFHHLSTCTRKYSLRSPDEKVEGLRGQLKGPGESTQLAKQLMPDKLGARGPRPELGFKSSS